jgi:AhpD family alkylhydroperoxidase
MDERTREIAAIAASVIGHCQPCQGHKLAKAREQGVPEEDIQSAIKLAKIISEAWDLRMLEFAEGLMKEGDGPPSIEGPRPDARGG